jgi:hypothetical protein
MTADTLASVPRRFAVHPQACARARNVLRDSGGSGLWTTTVVRVGIGLSDTYENLKEGGTILWVL